MPAEGLVADGAQANSNRESSPRVGIAKVRAGRCGTMTFMTNRYTNDIRGAPADNRD